jgi:hypothetical protein
MSQWVTGGGFALIAGLPGDILLAIFLTTWRNTQAPGWGTMASATAAMTGILLLLFGSQWGASVFLYHVDFRPFLEPYVVVLAALMTPVSAYILIRILAQVPR